MQAVSNTNRIALPDIYDKNLNFLVGSGASLGLLPTLKLGVKNESNENFTIETLSKRFSDSGDKFWNTLLFLYYYLECIKPAIELTKNTIKSDPHNVMQNYARFLDTILSVLSRKSMRQQRCNIFTTNYDGCFEMTADKMLQEGDRDFILNDGTRGFLKRHLHIKNFNSAVVQKSVFEQHQTEIPQINLLHMHGSIYWREDDDNIIVDYADPDKNLLNGKLAQAPSISNAFKSIEDIGTCVESLKKNKLDPDAVFEFWKEYKKLPIVNPTKWKFHQTVFEEHYYQMMRQLNYELEKPNSILITFGFSFADEHILRLVQRALGNPTLQLYVCCFDQQEQSRMQERFKKYNNVMFVGAANDEAPDRKLNFGIFNDDVFSINNIEEAYT